MNAWETVRGKAEVFKIRRSGDLTDGGVDWPRVVFTLCQPS